MSAFSQIDRILDEVLAECIASPIDLLDIGDMDGETAYLVSARASYERTCRDVARLLSGYDQTERPLRVLEVGAYLGVVSVTLARSGCDVTALDLPEFMENPRLQERLQREGITTVAANLRDYPLPFEPGQFDLVIMCETLEHLNFNPLPVLAEMNRSLAPSGLLYLALPNLASLPNRVKLLFGVSVHNPVADFKEQLSREGNMIVGLHWREYTRQELIELLFLVNFQVVEHRYETVPGSSLPARLAYQVLPALRPAQSLVARKEGEVGFEFRFTEATR